MVTLKTLMLKKNKTKTKQCVAIIYFKRKLSLFRKDHTRQAKRLLLLWFLKKYKFQKLKKVKEMLLEPSCLK